MNAASSLALALPAGRGPSFTWYSSSDHARSASNRSVPAAAVAACSAVGAGVSATGFGSLPAPHAASTNTQVSAGSTRLVIRADGFEQIGEAGPRLLAACRDVLGRHVVGLVAAQDPPGDGLAVDLVGAVVQAGGAGVAVHRLKRQVGRVTERAVDLQRAVDDLEEHVGPEELDQADVRAGGGRAL